MKYNIYFEVVASIFLAVQILFLRPIKIQKNTRSIIFTVLSCAIFIAQILDIISALCIDHTFAVSLGLNYFFNSLYFASIGLVGFLYFHYLTTYFNDKKYRGLTIVNFVVLISYWALILTSKYTHLVYYFDDSMNYIHGPLYLCIYFMDLYFTIVNVYIAFFNRSHFTKREILLAIVVFAAVFVGIMLQLVFPDVLLAMFSITLSVFLVEFSIETPDYRRLRMTMAELEQAREDARISAEEAIESERAKTDFMINMTREIRSPLNAILGYNQMISQTSSEERVKEESAHITTYGNMLMSVLNNLINFDTINTEDFEVVNEPFSTMDLVKNTVDFLNTTANSCNLPSYFNIDQKTPRELFGDIEKLKQIVYNLVLEAIRLNDGNNIGLDYKWENLGNRTGYLSVSVLLEDCVLLDDDIEAINKALDANNRSIDYVKMTSISMGMAIELISKMGGEIKYKYVHSTNPIFTFKIKCRISNSNELGNYDVSEEVAIKETNQYGSIYAPDAKILVVDDNASNIRIFKHILANSKITIDTASNGKETIDVLSKNKYHIVFLDYMMPEMDGMETLEYIKKNHLCDDTPLVLLTTNTVEDTKNVYQAVGFDEYLSKPIALPELERVIRKLLPDEFISELKYYDLIEDGNSNAQFDMGKLTLFDQASISSIIQEWGGDISFFASMLKNFYDNKKDDKLSVAFIEKDYRTYESIVHDLKGTAPSIGAETLAYMLREMDERAKLARDIKDADACEYIEEHHNELQKMYQGVLTQINNLIYESDYQFIEGNRKTLDVEKKHVVVADSDVINLHILQKLLSDNYNITTCKTAAEVLENVNLISVDLLLVDINLSDMDGIELLKKIKENPKTNYIPVIIITSDSNTNTETKVFSAGGSDYIIKPYAAEVLLSRIGRIIKIKELQNNLQAEVNRQTEEMQRQSEQSLRNYFATIRSLASTIDAKDSYTAGHSDRVATYAKMIAAKCGMDEEAQNRIYYIGLLHDIGKISIPDAIINKPGKLTDEEFEIIKNHSAKGEEIIYDIDTIADLRAGVRSHHERYDGKGYPDGLKGDDIPFVARIITVADTYDAMSSNRSYRKMLPQNVIRSEFVKLRGIQFDPQLADYMVEIIDEDYGYKLHQ